MYNCVLSGSDFTDADMGAAIIKCCNLKNVKFENCNMERANLLGCTEIDIHDLVMSKNLKHVKVDKTIKCQIKNAYPQVQLD